MCVPTCVCVLRVPNVQKYQARVVAGDEGARVGRPNSAQPISAPRELSFFPVRVPLLARFFRPFLPLFASRSPPVSLFLSLSLPPTLSPSHPPHLSGVGECRVKRHVRGLHLKYDGRKRTKEMHKPGGR